MPKNSKKAIDKIIEGPEEGFDLQPEDHVIAAIETLGENVEKHSTEVKTAGKGVEKAMKSLSDGVIKALNNAAKKDNSKKTTQQISEIIKLSLEIFDKKQAGLVNKITASNFELKTQAEAIVEALNRPKHIVHKVERNSIGLIEEVVSKEVVK